jgi:hypothetical protein
MGIEIVTPAIPVLITGLSKVTSILALPFMVPLFFLDA